MGFPNERDPCSECTLCISRHYLNTGFGGVDWVLRTDIMRSVYPCPDWQIHMLGAPHPPAAPPRNYRAKWERGNRARFLSVHPPHNNYSRKYHSDRGSGAGGGGRMSSRSRGSLLPSHKCKTEKILIHLTRLEIDISRRNCGWYTSELPHSTFFSFLQLHLKTQHYS